MKTNRKFLLEFKPVLPALLFLFFVSGLFAQEDWNQIRDKEGITVFTRSNPGMDFKEFRSSMIVDGTLDQFLAVLYDIEGLSSWGYNVKKASLLRREADTIQVYYTEAKAPFPYKNRDGVYLNRFTWNSEERKLHVDIVMPEDLMPEKENLVRMEGYGSWLVHDRKDGKLEITFQMQMDPGGSIPAWMANMFAGDTPYHTLLGLRKAMLEKKYQGKTYDFIR
ncbi:MAG: START domain-containing protein [Lutimonas sp.]